MAKQPEQLADGFETENTGGVLSGLLAEEDVLDRRALWRLGSWAAASVGAVIVALYASQSSMSSRREQVAAADLARQSQQIQSLTKESQNEARRLASAIDTLNSDRDRLYSRVTVLEQGLDSVTGAIAKQVAGRTPSPAATAPAVTPEPQTTVQNPPVLAPVATAVAKATDTPQADKTTPAQALAFAAKSGERPPTDKASPEPAPATVAAVAPKVAAPSPMSAPLVASKSIMAPPDAAAAKPIEPEQPASAVTTAPMREVVAAAPPADKSEPDASQEEPPKLAVPRTDFGVDLGGANSVGGLRALWHRLLKSRSNAALTTLRPIVVIRENGAGLGMQLRLVAGPLSDAAAAAKICAGLMESDRTCETTVFDGQRLAMKADEPAASGAPVTPTPMAPAAAATKPVAHRFKRATVEPPEKKPDPPSTLSSFFSRR